MKTQTLQKKLKKIKLVIFDVDGTLTDGKIMMAASGEEGKVFSSRDGIRMSLAARAGIILCFFTGRKSKTIEKRAKNTDVSAIWYKNEIKDDLFWLIKNKFGIAPEEVLYAGDDLIDLGFMERAGVAVSPADGALEVQKLANYVTKAKGGEGVAAEILELLLKAQGKWDIMVKKVTNNFKLLA